MSAIWHEPNTPSWLGAGPRFSFFDIAEIVQPAPAQYEEARARLQAWERRLGAVFYQHNAMLAWTHWQRHNPWWLI